MSDQSSSGDEGGMDSMSELQLLKLRASKLGITHSNNISIATLRAKIEAKLNGEPEVPEEMTNAPGGNTEASAVIKERPITMREQLYLEYMRLVRCRIQCLDPKKKELRGEIFTVGNELIGTVRKFVPFGEVTDAGYHIPYCIYLMMDERRFVNITITKDRGTGRETVRTHMAKEFAIEILPPLTEEQLDRLATAQAAAGSVDDVAA